MNEFVFALIYVAAGLAGAGAHWFKKHYIDQTTNDSFKEYLFTNLPTTFYTLAGIVFAEINLSLLQAPAVSLVNIIGALTLGYTFDSGINKSSEAQLIKEEVELMKPQ
jgi:hypothetical protein